MRKSLETSSNPTQKQLGNPTSIEAASLELAAIVSVGAISSFGIWALLSSTYFFGFILYLFHFDFSLFLYPYPLGTAFASIENLFLCMNLYYSIPISSRNFPRKIPNWIQN